MREARVCIKMRSVKSRVVILGLEPFPFCSPLCALLILVLVGLGGSWRVKLKEDSEQICKLG